MTEKKTTEEKLKNLECPFTWKLDEIDIVKENGESQPQDDEDLVPIFKFMRLIVNVYENVVKEDFAKAYEYVKLSEKIFQNMHKEKCTHICLEVVENILNGTKCHLELRSKNFEKAEKILQIIKEIDYAVKKKSRSTLNGCKSLAWSKYKEAGKRGIGKAIEFAKRAIEDMPEFAGWHFIQGKNLRRQRRGPQLFNQPREEEIEAFKIAYKLSPKPIYGVHVALMYKEKKEYYKALRMYEEIFNTNPESCTIKLRLALGFIRSGGPRELLLAKKCLDYVEERSPEDCMYLHYRGVYLEALGKLDAAADYYLKASKDMNYGAEMSFLRCKSKQKANYDFITHLQKMIKNYASTDECRELDLLLQIAGYFFIIKKDIPNAAKYYLQAFEKNPKSYLFENHQPVFIPKSTNIYKLLKTEFLPAASQRRDLDFSTKEACLKLKKYCDRDLLNFVESFEDLKLK